jgi:hypothetical protein
MQKVNEVQWAAVCRVNGQAMICSWDRDTVESHVRKWPMSFRLARVRITEIEEGEEDGKEA